MKQSPTLSSDAGAVSEIEVRTANRSYQAIVGAGLLGTLGARAAKLFRAKNCALLTDSTTAPLLAERARESLRADGFETALITVPAGENSKTLERAGEICDAMQRTGMDRSSFLVALGGGVIGDLGGFAAAIFHRGISCVQVPTTLLAQVDSAIGGKCGVNTSVGKNLLGAIHQPALVLADVETLGTLPTREFQQGFAEIVKHAIIADAEMLDALRLPLPQLIARNLRLKAEVVSRDERDENGARALLNFGHTLGHAIERAAGYGTLLHGEAISLGIIAACEISVRKFGLTNAEREKVIAALKAVGLPTQLPAGIENARILEAMHADKKFEGGEIRFVVTPRLGSARLTSDVTLEDLRAALLALRKITR